MGRLGAPVGLLGRILGIQERQKQPLGNVVITFYEDNNKASITSAYSAANRPSIPIQIVQ
jgi:hypothetical protein